MRMSGSSLAIFTKRKAKRRRRILSFTFKEPTDRRRSQILTSPSLTRAVVVAVEAAEDVADADEADVDVTGMTVDLVRIVAPVRIVDLVRIVDPERIVEMLHPAVVVEMDLAVVAVEDPVVEEAVG